MAAQVCRERASLIALLAASSLVACADVAVPDARDPWSASGQNRLAEGSDRTSNSASLRAPEPLFANADSPAQTVRSDAPTTGKFPYLAEVPALEANAPAIRYADMSDRACDKQIDSLKLPVDRKSKAYAGVALPMRLTGSLHGVRFVTPGKTTPFGVVDCRLILALNDFAGALAAANVSAVQIDNFYRPHAHLPGKKAASQHALALAADIDTITLTDGRTLSVGNDWHAAIGSVSCGPQAVLDDPTPEAITLRNIVCAVARRGIFHHMLTPSFNAEHRTHLHFDIKKGDTRQSVR